MSFEKRVFINCPFDAGYAPPLEALCFTVLYLGFKPCLSQTLSSSVVRVNQIKQLIRTSKYGIHDLSRSRAMNPGEFPRFNMPFELGLDIGCTEFGTRKHSKRKALVLESERYNYQRVLSDIAGQDIENHNDDPETLMQKVRNWFSNVSGVIVPGYSEIWLAFNAFEEYLEAQLKNRYSEREMNNMTIGDYIKYAILWMKSTYRS